MRFTPTVSVVIPVYNEKNQLGLCLDHLLEQDDELAEIILVDNNSTDGSLELAQHYAENWPLVKVIREKRQGIVPARNRGFLAASGDIIARIDADTRVQPGWAAAIKDYFANHPGVTAITGWTHYYDLPLDNFTGRVSDLIHNEANELAAGSISLYGPNMALRLEIARELAASSCDDMGRLNEDMDLTIHLMDQGLEIAFVPEMMVYISGRRIKYSPVNFVPYCLNWPRTYWRHHYYRAAAWTLALSIFFCFMQALICLPLRAYDHEKLAFSWRQLIEFEGDRIIP